MEKYKVTEFVQLLAHTVRSCFITSFTEFVLMVTCFVQMDCPGALKVIKESPTNKNVGEKLVECAEVLFFLYRLLVSVSFFI